MSHTFDTEYWIREKHPIDIAAEAYSKARVKELDEFLSLYIQKRWYIPAFLYRKIFKLETHDTENFGEYRYVLYRYWKKVWEKVGYPFSLKG